jgi:hypothetical protein
MAVTNPIGDRQRWHRGNLLARSSFSAVMDVNIKLILPLKY